MVLLFDNYDSFTYNLLDLFKQNGVDIMAIRNDEFELSEIIKLKPEAIVISPGPGRPESSGVLMPLIEYFHSKVPILGVCLGLQALALFFGAKLVHAKLPMHGKASSLNYTDHLMFNGVPQGSKMMRYHSLIIEELPSEFIITAKSEQDEIMAISHSTLPLWAVQFHPESILSEYGHQIIKNWLTHFQIISNFKSNC